MPPARRRDAARNQARVLAAAEELVAQSGAAALRIADVAAAAGVGAGTVYRAFADKRGLLIALVDERERELQDAVIRGAPPLGPGAPPPQRLRAFLQALLELVVAQREVLVVADEGSPVSRHHTGAHQAWRRHIAHLLGEMHVAGDPDVLAELLLAPLAAGVQVHLIDERGVQPRVIAAALDVLLEGLGVASGTAHG
jgi:AcrR family transcriptional regulator